MTMFLLTALLLFCLAWCAQSKLGQKLILLNDKQRDMAAWNLQGVYSGSG